MRKVSRRKFLKTLGIGAIAGAGAACYAQDCTDSVVVERHELRLPSWDAEGARVALLADLHVNNEKELARGLRAVQMAVDLKPDLVLVAGDFINASGEEPLRNIT